VGDAPLLLYTDGSGSGRSARPGGWAFAVVRGEALLAEAWGAHESTTALLMEFAAAHAALEWVRARGLHREAPVVLVSDCRIVLDAATGAYLPRPLRETAQALHVLAKELAVTTRWVRAHAGDSWNEAVDVLAREARG